ncbi:Heparan sulfate 2-O-sulfotransferase hst-2 [Holothuria leucospilota]|uniref:Heparan sulfate 2-O-sulfotransferase hst-2 n=1 Tax=Holothuria leucospilota TaxID=206669 RepID=A0A9Q1BG32_HOLLE|nr:Heparan sulfate 2-O-sulfotransferase hst-2 [Holothuria leucospilota]
MCCLARALKYILTRLLLRDLIHHLRSRSLGAFFNGFKVVKIMTSSWRIVTVLATRFLNFRYVLLLFVSVIILTNCFLILRNRKSFRGEGSPNLERKEVYHSLVTKGNRLENKTTSRYGKPVVGTNLIVLYNAVPKTGSRNFDFLVREYQVVHRKKYITTHIFPQNLTQDSKLLKDYFTHLRSGSFVRGHFPFTEIKRNDVHVVYMNTIRDPLQRLISNYYYDMYGDNETYPRYRELQYHEKTIDECISKQGDCFNNVYEYYKQQTFSMFCGSAPVCRTYSRETLEIAKRNLEKYTVVSETAKFDSLVSIMEALLPDYLKGIKTFTKRVQKQMKGRFHTSRKVPPQNLTVAFIKRDLQLEYEFYDFAMKKFRQLETALLSSG